MIMSCLSPLDVVFINMMQVVDCGVSLNKTPLFPSQPSVLLNFWISESLCDKGYELVRNPGHVSGQERLDK